MYQLCEFSSNKKWKLQYRATRDGFSAENFHSKCDGFENTLTLIKSEHGNIFGGFAEKKWLPTREFIIDPKAYIFSLVNKGNRPFKVLCSKNATAICCSPIFGPTFGAGFDIFIASNSNRNQESYSKFGHSYKHADFPVGTANAYSILGGSNYFQILEIEVFVQPN